jgi:lactate permease
MDLLLAALPLLLLIWLLGKPRPVAAALALPLAALLAWILRLGWFADPPLLPTAALIDGAFTALTPLLIVWGAILFFRVLEAIGALATIRASFEGISPHPVARLMIIGWAFAFLVEGVSGFGTPAALAAPILVGLGFSALRVAAMTLAMNSVPVAFGAIGTPMWFGFAPLDLSAELLRSVAWQTALLNAVAALVVPAVALRLVVDWRRIREAWGFIALSVLATVIPYLLVATWDVEFPSVIGGACGLAAAVSLARWNVGLPAPDPCARPAVPADDAQRAVPSRRQIAAAFAPFAAVIVILVLTRLPGLGLRDFLAAVEPVASGRFGSLGEIGISASGALLVGDILGTGAESVLRTLYVPGLLPLALVAVASALFARLPWRELWAQTREATLLLRRPALALVAAVALVELLLIGGERASARLIGLGLAEVSGAAWPLLAPLLGAFGSFLSGSATVSNLTFGGIQWEIAAGAQLDPSRVLALQAAGASMGNMVCVHNIVAVLAVLGVHDAEGPVLRTTVRVLALYAVIVAAVGLLL